MDSTDQWNDEFESKVKELMLDPEFQLGVGAGSTVALDSYSAKKLNEAAALVPESALDAGKRSTGLLGLEDQIKATGKVNVANVAKLGGAVITASVALGNIASVDPDQRLDETAKQTVGVAAAIAASAIAVALLTPLALPAVAVAAIATAVGGIASYIVTESWESIKDLHQLLVDYTADALWQLFGPNDELDPSSAFQTAETTLSPIAIDLNGDGIKTLSKDANIYFDHDKNGMAEQTGWVAADDGLLVLDRNADGQINNGGELFGNNTELAGGTNAANGFEALKELDANGDGIIDSNDAQFDELRIWQDTNSDGLSQSDELLTLEQAGIASLNIDYSTVSTEDGNGNITRQTSTAEMADGSTADTADIWFGVNLTRTIEQDLLELSEEVSALPDATAFGNVRSLHWVDVERMKRLQGGGMSV